MTFKAWIVRAAIIGFLGAGLVANDFYVINRVGNAAQSSTAAVQQAKSNAALQKQIRNDVQKLLNTTPSVENAKFYVAILMAICEATPHCVLPSPPPIDP